MLQIRKFNCYRSGAFKEEYERCRLDVTRAEEEAQFSYQQKLGLVDEVEQARKEKEEADKYAQLKQELVSPFISLKRFYICHHFNLKILTYAGS